MSKPYVRRRATILEITRLKTSVNGNPRYELVVDDGLGWAGVFTTQSDNQLNYEIGNTGYRAGDDVFLELTKAGRICGIASYTLAEIARNAHEKESK